MDIFLVGLLSIAVGAILAYWLSAQDMLSSELEVVNCGAASTEGDGHSQSIEDIRNLTGESEPNNICCYQDLVAKGIFEKQEVASRITGISKKDRIRLAPVIAEGDSLQGLGIESGDILWIETDMETIKTDCQPGKLVVLAYQECSKVKVRELVEPHPDEGWWITRSSYTDGDWFAKHHEKQIVGIVRFHTRMPSNVRKAA